VNYLIYGNSYKLIDDKLKEIIKSKEVNTYYMEDIDINQIIEDISYTSLFDNEKTIIVKNVEILFNNTKKNIDKLNKLKDYLENPNDTSTLILISNEKIDVRTKVNKEILSYLNIIQTPIYTKTYELTNNINKILKDYGYTINQINLETLINKCLNNYDIIINEITKLKEIKKPGIITNKDIEDIISNYNINDIFGFKDAVLNKE
jgi:DNA polymerase III delta subunit